MSGTTPPTFPRDKDGNVLTSNSFTDKFCAIISIAGVAGMVFFVLMGYWYGGDRARLTRGVDWEGNVCGVDAAVIDRPFMMFCGSPERTAATTGKGPSFPKYIIQGSTVCVAKCPTGAENPPVKLSCLMPAFHNFTSYVGGEISSVGGSIPDVETLKMVITQSVQQESAYPTEDYGGRFCLPSSANKELRDMVIDGPWGAYYRPLVSLGGLVKSWPILAIAAAIGLVFGYIYIMLLENFAGLIMFGTMVFSTLFSLAAGVYFFLAVVFDTDKVDSDWAKFNPIMSMYIGDEAKIYSIITGIIFIIIGVVSGCFTAISTTHVDECIGLIDAACEPFRNGGGLYLTLFPVIQSGLFLFLLGLFTMVGLPLVASCGHLDHSEISINGEGVQGLAREWKKTWWQHVGLYYYLVGIVLLLEFYIQFGNYVICYAISSWYFTPNETVKVDNNPLLAKAAKGGKQIDVRVAGVDANYGARKGTVVGDDAGRMLVVPIGKKGPGLGRNDLATEKITKKPFGFSWIIGGCFTGITYHVGSIALGCPIIFMLRPFRMLSDIVSAFFQRTADSLSNDPHTASIKGCSSLLTACLDQVFGKFSKTAWTELVLSGGSGGGFQQSAEAAFDRLIKAGGSISHLHGSMLLYDLYGSFCITLLSGWVCMILQDKVDLFNDMDSQYRITDKNVTTIGCLVVTWIVAFAFMSVWSQTADVLLYCLAWNRKTAFEGHQKKASDALLAVGKYAPGSLQSLLPAHELDIHQEHGLHAHGIGQQGAILAAMEHGAMSGGNGAPDYAKKFAGAHAMTTKLLG